MPAAELTATETTVRQGAPTDAQLSGLSADNEETLVWIDDEGTVTITHLTFRVADANGNYVGRLRLFGGLDIKVTDLRWEG